MRFAQGVRQGYAACGVEGKSSHAAQYTGFQRAAQRIAHGKLADQRLITVEQGLAASLQAVGLDGRKTVDAVEPATAEGGAEVLRHDDAPLGVELLFEGREEHLATTLPQPAGSGGQVWDIMGSSGTQ